MLDSIERTDYLHDVDWPRLAAEPLQSNRKQMGSTPSGDFDPTPIASASPQHMTILRDIRGCALARDRI